MADGLSQSDLDALFGSNTLSTEDKPESSDSSECILNGLETLGADPGKNGDEPGAKLSGDESLTQEEIDKLLREFLG
ncbi:MAG: hypothetical protein ACYDHW_11045 [Syntrophorhabdaceae bacterium]